MEFYLFQNQNSFNEPRRSFSARRRKRKLRKKNFLLEWRGKFGRNIFLSTRKQNYNMARERRGGRRWGEGGFPPRPSLAFLARLEKFTPAALRKLCFHFLSHWMENDRGDSFPSDFEPNGIPFGSKSKGKLSPRSYPIQFERKYSFLSMISK